MLSHATSKKNHPDLFVSDRLFSNRLLNSCLGRQLFGGTFGGRLFRDRLFLIAPRLSIRARSAVFLGLYRRSRR